jgi:hypothetical protein
MLVHRSQAVSDHTAIGDVLIFGEVSLINRANKCRGPNFFCETASDSRGE